MRCQVTVIGSRNSRADVLLDVDEARTVGDLRAAVASALKIDKTEGAWVDGVRVSDEATVAEAAIRPGVTISLTRRAQPNAAAHAGPFQLHCVTGRDAGLVIDLPVGRHELGRTAFPALTDAGISRRHALLSIADHGVTIIDLASANGTTVDGIAVPVQSSETTAPVPVQTGQIIGLGDVLFSLSTPSLADAAVESSATGTINFTRPPRMRPAEGTRRITMPAAPRERVARRIPIAMMVIPLVLGVAMWKFGGSKMFLLFAAMTPVMALSNVVSDRRSGAKSNRAANEKYRSDLSKARAQLQTALGEEVRRRRRDAPDAATAYLAATLPTAQLWERRRTDPDALLLRVATADQASTVDVVRQSNVLSDQAADQDDEPLVAPSVPATIALGEVGVLGVAGPQDDVRGVLRWLVVQLAVHHTPRDLSLTVLAPNLGDEWNWVRWLPHCAHIDPDRALGRVGFDNESMTARVAEIASLVKRRTDSLGPRNDDRAQFPAHVVLLDGARQMRGVPGLLQVLRDGPDVGMYAICADLEQRLLPEECTATVSIWPDDPVFATVQRSGVAAISRAFSEQLSGERAEAIARALTPLRDVSPGDDDAALPESARLLDLVGMHVPTADTISTRWSLATDRPTMPLGVGAGGVFSIDICDDGPHGLIAGTTGAGKSELLQSMIASWAIGSPPDLLNFVLVDYKGGSAFKDCVNLPHTVGMVTDLDAHLVERALTSLGAELKRRETLLADSGVKDLDDYNLRRRREPALPRIPRLILVIDEFASLVRDLPDFVTGLVSIAQRGRSLGIHLLLATQRPSGVVSADIRANTNLRICLRVTDAVDSSDVIGTADAARIAQSTPGRAFARIGHSQLEPFQTGRVGGRWPGARPRQMRKPFVAPIDAQQLGYPAPEPPKTAAKPSESEVTDLAVLVDVIAKAAESAEAKNQRSPWLPALPDVLTLADLPPSPDSGSDLAHIPYGLSDVPAEQRQEVAVFDLANAGPMLVIGSPRSGRSQFLRTLAGSAATVVSSGNLHLYCVDCGSGALTALEEMPHCGAVVQRNQPERATRLLNRLSEELERRQSLFAERDFADITEQRRTAQPPDRLPHILVLIDRWEGFTATLGELDGGRLTETVLNLVREGASVGIHIVITGDRSLASGRISSLTDNKLALRLADRNDYALLSVRSRDLPTDMPAGRLVAASSAIETQTALLGADPSGQAQAAVLAEIAAKARRRDAKVKRRNEPFRVDVLPTRLTFASALRMVPEQASPQFALVGAGGDEITAIGPDFATSLPGFVVAGPNRSGRSTTLMVMARSLITAGTRVAIGAPAPSPLRELEGAKNVLRVVTDPRATADEWTEILSSSGEAPVVVVLDDAELLRDAPAGEVFRGILKGVGGPGRALVLAGHPDAICTGLSGWQVDAKKARQGALLSPQTTGDGELIGLRLPRSVVGQPVQPGRALVHLGDGRLISVVVPNV